MSGCSRVNSANDSRYAAATCSSHNRTVTTVRPPGSSDRPSSIAATSRTASVSASPPKTSVETRGPETHFSPVTTIERTMWRPNATNNTISGTIATVVAAITNVHCAL